MTLDEKILLQAQTRALGCWRELQAAACAAEAQLLRAELQHLRGHGPRPDPALRARAVALRTEANAWREATPLDFRRGPHPHPQAHAMMYAPAAADNRRPSEPKNSMRVLATREPRRNTSARNSKLSPTAGRR